MRPAPAATSLLLAALALGAAACGDSPQDPSAPTAPMPAIPAADSRGVDLGQCDELNVPEGSKLVLHVYAEGVQIYQYDNGTWAPRGPSATLYADAGGSEVIGIHYGGPTWESNSGSLVEGRLNKPCVDEAGPADIPWLLLDGIRSKGPGIFNRVAFIQRVNTAGGKAPSAPGSQGEVRNVPYTAEYLFYRAH